MPEKEEMPEGIEGAAMHVEGVLLENYLNDLRSTVQELTECKTVPKYTRLMQIRAVNRHLIDYIAELRKSSQAITTSYQRQFGSH